MKKHPVLFCELLGLGLTLSGIGLYAITSWTFFVIIASFGIIGMLTTPIALWFLTKQNRNNEFFEEKAGVDNNENEENKKVNENRDEALFVLISKLFNYTLEQAENYYKVNAKKIEELENCILLKRYFEEKLIINIVTKEYLYCKYPIQYEEFVNFYKEGKRNNDVDVIIKEKIGKLKESKLKAIEEKSITDGVDYMYLVKDYMHHMNDYKGVIFDEAEEEEYDELEEDSESDINIDINTEKTLFMCFYDADCYGELEYESKILQHKCCTLSVSMLVYQRIREWLCDDFEEDSTHYKFLFEIYNNIKNFKYEVGELLPNVKIENVEGKLCYSYPKDDFDFDIGSLQEEYDLPDFEREENEFNVFFNYLKEELEKNIKNSTEIIQNVKNQLKVDKNDILNLQFGNEDKMVDDYPEEKVDIR